MILTTDSNSNFKSIYELKILRTRIRTRRFKRHILETIKRDHRPNKSNKSSACTVPINGTSNIIGTRLHALNSKLDLPFKSRNSYMSTQKRHLFERNERGAKEEQINN